MIIRIQQEPAGAVFEFEIDGTLVTLRNLYDIVAARIKDSVPEGQVFFLDGLAEITYRHRNPAIGLRTPYCRGMVRPTSETVCDYLKECTVYDVFACKAPYDTRILLSVATNCELAALETIVDFVLGEPSPVTLKTLFGKGREEYVVKLSQDLVVTKPVGYGEPPDDTVYPHVVDFGAMPLPTQRDILLSVLGVLLRPDQNVIVQSSPDVKKYFIYTGSTARMDFMGAVARRARGLAAPSAARDEAAALLTDGRLVRASPRGHITSFLAGYTTSFLPRLLGNIASGLLDVMQTARASGAGSA